uniref:Uncharacterized protein n=1 Tax=Rhizophora mucronata TaxID=61149 RepID=A0A2P2IX05_RHIMU
MSSRRCKKRNIGLLASCIILFLTAWFTHYQIFGSLPRLIMQIK